MVFFNCNACGESLKKNQVEKHYLTKCRRCEVLSCVDCGKEFWGDSYQTHTKCISEEEKYSGKNYVAKVNKGEAKQEQWIQKVQAAIQKAAANPQLKTVLKRLEEFPNVPRKKAKFENFLKCSLRVFNTGLHNAVWDLLMAEAVQNGNATTSVEQESKTASGNFSENGSSLEARGDASENGAETSINGTNGNLSQSEDDTTDAPSTTKGKFNWAATITAVLQAKGEISIKKLRKKVLAEYASYGGNKPEEKLLAKFNKKVNALPQVKVLKDRAKLVQS
ncbi:hypothetical protein BaRGS_00036217 [Batillaria attramentaria]|uniref:Cell growth-regulating nucleolar protein n=1 Tax=Batillaria attramentaria TaxID=370345 RepID=A0ABD0JCH2_9CAEN